jgi:hypothetical protein
MHEKTFAAINKLKDIELELHRLKNALEMANRALDAQRPWVGLTDDAEIFAISNTMPYADRFEFARAIEAKLREKNNAA